MEVKQIYSILNDVTKEVLGESAVVNENLDNIVDIGTEVFNANAVDSYVKSLVNHIGKVIFVNRVYRGSAPSVLMDGWEYGSVLEKVSAVMPSAVKNESWDLTDGTDYSPNVFHKPIVSAKFYNKRITFEYELSVTEMQVKQSFSNETQLNGFLSMLYNEVEKAMTIDLDALIMRTINNMSAQTLNKEYPDEQYTTKSGVRAINLLKLYNDKFGQNLTADTCMSTPEFYRFASYQIGLVSDRLTKISTLFNVGGKPRFTPTDMQHIVLLSEFAKGAEAYLQSDTYHDEFTKLPNAETVPYWQGSGTNYDFLSTSAIHVNIENGSNSTEKVVASGILGVIFDRDALGVCNQNRRVTTNYNAKAEFWNNFYKFDAGYFNDLNENFVVFFVA